MSRSICSVKALAYSLGSSESQHTSKNGSKSLDRGAPIGSFFHYHKPGSQEKHVKKVQKDISKEFGLPHYSAIGLQTKMALKEAEKIMFKNRPVGFQWNTSNAISSSNDGAGGNNGLTLILRDGHFISFSLGTAGALENVKISSFLLQEGYSNLSQAQILENMIIFTEKHGNQIFIFTMRGRWKEVAVGRVDIIESLSMLCKSPQVNAIDTELADVQFILDESKPRLFAFNENCIKYYKLISKSSQSVSLVLIQEISAVKGDIQYLYQTHDVLVAVEFTKGKDPFDTHQLVFRSFIVNERELKSKNECETIDFKALVSHCIPLGSDYSQFLVCCMDCTAHIVDVSIGRVMKSIIMSGNPASVSHHPFSALISFIMSNGNIAFYDRGLNPITMNIGLIEVSKTDHIPISSWLSRSSMPRGTPCLTKWGQLMDGSDSSSLFICYEMGPVVMLKLEYSSLIGNLKTSSVLCHYLEVNELEKAFNLLECLHGVSSYKCLQILSSFISIESNVDVIKRFLELMKCKFRGYEKGYEDGKFLMFKNQLQLVSRRHVMKLIRMGHEDYAYHFIRHLELHDLLFPLLSTKNGILSRLVRRDLKKWSSESGAQDPVLSNFNNIVFSRENDSDRVLEQQVDKIVNHPFPKGSRKAELVNAMKLEVDLKLEEATELYSADGKHGRKEQLGLLQMRSLEIQ